MVQKLHSDKSEQNHCVSFASSCNDCKLWIKLSQTPISWTALQVQYQVGAVFISKCLAWVLLVISPLWLEFKDCLDYYFDTTITLMEKCLNTSQQWQIKSLPAWTSSTRESKYISPVYPKLSSFPILPSIFFPVAKLRSTVLTSRLRTGCFQICWQTFQR